MGRIVSLHSHRRHHRICGITGGIGSGKSTVAGMLAECGTTVVDADQIARSLTDVNGAAIEPIRQRFGPAFITPNGALNREEMRKQAFTYPIIRSDLEAIIHPLIGRKIDQILADAPTGIIVLDIPLLVESAHWRKQIDHVVVVDCGVDTQIRRVMKRNDWSANAVQSVIEAQASRADRLKAADVVIFNEHLTLSELKSEVQCLYLWLGL